MSKRSLAWIAAVSALIALISVFTLDRGIAYAVHNSGHEGAQAVVYLRDKLDILTGRGLVGSQINLGQFLLGSLFIAVGVLWMLARRTSHAARAFIFAGVVQLATITAGWEIKDVFGRQRPFQLIASEDWAHIWFMGGNSFPSGHNTFFWGLCLPLAYQFPKLRIPLLVVPVFIAFARIIENYHFVSDVLAAIALAALMTLLGAIMFDRWVKPPTSRRLDAARRR